MSGRYRRLLSALGRCLIVCLALSGHVHAQEVDNADAKSSIETSKSTPTQNLTPTLSAIQKGIEDVATAIESVGAGSNSEENQKREAADLRAQEDMAYWAAWMFGATAFSAAFTLIGVLLLGVTLAYTKWTLDEAGKTTLAAKDTIDVTREIGEAQTRAYLTVTQATVRVRANSPTPDVTFKLQNTGNSPATVVKLYYFATYDGAFSRGHSAMIGPDACDVKDISPRETGVFQHTFEDLNLSDLEIARLTAEEPITFRVRLRIVYDDVFDARVTQDIQWDAPLPKFGTETALTRRLPADSRLKVERLNPLQQQPVRAAVDRTVLQKLLGVFPT